MKKFLTMIFLALFSFGVTSSYAQDDRNVSEYNLNSQGVGLVNGNSSSANGFDPVAVFSEGGSVSLQGDAQFSLVFEGVEYLFSSQDNLEKFSDSPKKYEPTYGGWCARAMASGQKVHINTSLFTIHGNRSFFFVNKRAKRSFDRDLEGNAAKADSNWKKISGEAPRL